MRETFSINNLTDKIDNNIQEKFADEELGKKYKLNKKELYSYLMDIRSQRPYIDKIKPLFFHISQSLIEQQKAVPPLQSLQLEQISDVKK